MGAFVEGFQNADVMNAQTRMSSSEELSALARSQQSGAKT
jgi:hypothetical protein